MGMSATYLQVVVSAEQGKERLKEVHSPSSPIDTPAMGGGSM